MIGRCLRQIAAAATILSLTACWSGPPLFTARDNVRGAIPDGSYVIQEPVAPGETRPLERPGEDEALKVRAQPDGTLRVTAGSGPDTRDWRVVAVPLLGPTDRRFVLQLEDRKRAEVARGASYLVLDARETPLRLHIPSCDSEARAATEGSGGYVSRDPQSPSQCIFRDAAVLRAQLRRVITSDLPAEKALELVPLR